MRVLSLICFSLLISSIANATGNRVRDNGGQAYGCVTGDTLIQLANGKDVEIQDLISGDLLKNNLDDSVRVYYTVKGPENGEMFELVTESGKKIKATKGHPFYNQKGLIATKNITVGMSILTIDGFEMVVKNSAFSFNGMVYNIAVADKDVAKNLDLEQRDPFLGLKSQEHTVILNGFVTGDILIQRLLAK